MTTETEFESMTFAVKLGATLFFVLLNGFFVAAEFAFVTVRGYRVEVLAKSGSGQARIAQGILDRQSGHSRLALCGEELDSVIGIAHAKNVMAPLSEGRTVDLESLAREPVYVPDTQPLSRMIVDLQHVQAKAAIVLDDHGTAIGMAFLEDAIEEIVGPIRDEFDAEIVPEIRHAPDRLEVRGEMPLPEAVDQLGLEDIGTDDTIGGHVVSLVERLPVEGDQLTLGGYRVTVIDVSQRRIEKLRLERIKPESTAPES